MGFVIAALLFCVLIWMIAASVRSNKRRVNLTKKSNTHSTSNSSSPLFFFAGSIVIVHMMVARMIAEDLLAEIVEVAAVVAGIDENTPYMGVFLFKQTFD